MKPYNVLCVQYMDYVPLCLPCAMLQLTTATAVRWVYSIQQCYYTTHKYRIAENFRGRKLSRISRFVAIRESFLREILGRSTHRHSNLRILHENCIFHQFAKVFTLKSYGTISCTAEPKWSYSLIGQLLFYSALFYTTSSDTVSRCGVFCSFINAMECCKTEGIVDVFQVVKALRIQKPGSVLTVVSMSVACTSCRMVIPK